MAVSVFWQPPSVVDPEGRGGSSAVICGAHGESKQQALESATVSQLAREVVRTGSADYLFVARDYSHRAEYERGYRLPDVMPVGTTAVVTAVIVWLLP